MINLVLFKKEWKSNWVLLLIFMAVLSMYSLMITAMFDPKLGDSLRAMSESMPQIFAAFGMADVGTTMLEFLTGYLYGMLFIAFPGVFFIILNNRLGAKYVDNGSMAYLLAAPEKRSKFALTQVLFSLLCCLLLVLYLSGLLLAACGIMFPGELDTRGFFYVNVGLFGVFLMLGGFCLMTSFLFNDSKTALGVSSGFVIYSILVQMISQVGDKFEKLKYATPLTLFKVDALAAGEASSWLACSIMYGLGILCMGVGVLHFSRKNIPV